MDVGSNNIRYRLQIYKTEKLFQSLAGESNSGVDDMDLNRDGSSAIQLLNFIRAINKLHILCNNLQGKWLQIFVIIMTSMAYLVNSS